MKTSLITKVAVSAMAVALGAGVVGSISGTVAWFQYSTRSTVAYQGAAAHCTENLQISVDGKNWKSDLTAAELKDQVEKMGASAALDAENTTYDGQVNIDEDKFLEKNDYADATFFAEVGEEVVWKLGTEVVSLADYGVSIDGDVQNADEIVIKVTIGSLNETLKPVTSGKLGAGEVAGDLYRNPIYQYPEMGLWKKATSGNEFVDIPLQLRVLDVDGEETESTLKNKPIYLTDLTMAAANESNSTKIDVTPALRVAVSSKASVSGDLTPYATFSDDTGAEANATTRSIQAHGQLDLNADGKPDEEENYEWEKTTSDGNGGYYGTRIDYGAIDASKEVVLPEGVSFIEGGEAIFLAAHNAAGNYVFHYDNGAWSLGEQAVTLATLGLQTELTADFTVTVNDVDDNYAVSTLNSVKAETTNGIADDSDPYDIKGVALGNTNDDGIFFVNVRIYLEGWQELEFGTSAASSKKVLWDAAKTIGAKFNVGLRFSTSVHEDHN